VSDEVRAHALRGSDSARELSTTMAEVGSEISKLHAHIEQSREASTDAAQEAARVAGATAEVDRALVELGERVRKTTGSDPETARAVADASEHARALVAALGSMSGKVPRSLLLAALRPVLEPLARLLAEDDETAEEETEG
jgi:methyl-accepting chemotaxis protein